MKDLPWKQELNLLYELDQKERKNYVNFLISKGYIPGTYIKNWQIFAEEYVKLHNLGDRIFGDSFRDFRIKRLVENFSEDAILDSDLRFKLYCLVKHLDQDKDTQNKFLIKLKCLDKCDEIVKSLEDRIKISENVQLQTKILV